MPCKESARTKERGILIHNDQHGHLQAVKIICGCLLACEWHILVLNSRFLLKCTVSMMSTKVKRMTKKTRRAKAMTARRKPALSTGKVVEGVRNKEGGGGEGKKEREEGKERDE